MDESGVGPEDVKISSASRLARHGGHEVGPMQEPVAGHAYGEELATRVAGGASLSGAVGLIEVVVRNGVRLGGIEGGRLVEVEERIGVVRGIFRRRRAGGSQWWCGCGKPEVAEDAGDGEWIREEGEDAHFGAAVGFGPSRA